MIGDRLVHLDVVDSTNRYARELVRDQAAEGTVVTAERQTAGRGRLDRSWISAPLQNVLASVILYPERAAEQWGGIPLMAGLAVATAASTLAGVDAHLNWPNDVLVAQRKLSGILVESGQLGSRPWAVVGIGINVNQTRFEGEYRRIPTSLMLEAGRPFDTGEVLSTVCGAFDRLYTAWRDEGNAPILAEWRRATRMFGRIIVIEDAGGKREARAVGLGDDGSLRVEHPDGGVEYLLAGDVSLTEEQS